MIAWWLAVVMTVAAAQAPAGPAADLAAAKALYASGSYEEALAKLSAVTSPDAADEADQYRALCLLALGRTADTERSLETLILRRPLFKMSEADVSPRLVTMFRTTRRRLLPDAARALYGRAKKSFDQKEFVAASADLKTLLQILSDEDMDRNAPAVADLALLADGFLRLSDAEIAAAARASAPPPAPAPAPTTSAPPARSEPSVYSIADTDVAPPVELSRPLPPWRPPNPVAAAREHRGILRIVINEQGRVESASLVQPVAAGYDPLLLSSARQWQFRPATRAGVPVKYSRDIPIVLAPVAR